MTLRLALTLSIVVSMGCDKKTEPPPPAAPVATAPSQPPDVKSAPAAPPSVTPTSWVTYVQPEKLFSARFPAKPEENESKADSAIGPITMKMAMYSHASGKAYAAMASVYHLPSGTIFDTQKALDGARDGMIGKIPGGKIVSEKPSKLDGYDGREMAFEGPGPGGKPIRGVARIYTGTDPPAAYLAFTVSMTGDPDPDAATFMESLHVGKGVGAK